MFRIPILATGFCLLHIFEIRGTVLSGGHIIMRIMEGLLRVRERASLRILLCLALLLVLSSIFLGLAPRRQKNVLFPKEFLWGSATAAQQVEGGNTNNDWYEWEQLGKTRDKAGLADDEYNRYDEDFEIAKNLNQNAFRLSVEWSRIEPSEGVFSQQEILHYRDVLIAAHNRGLKTFVTLHHFSNPLWAYHQGSWLNPKMPQWFGGFAAYAVANLGDLVDYWITLNEPTVHILTGYVAGVTPPGRKDLKTAMNALANLLKGHAAAYHVIHALYPKAPVGIAHHMRVFHPARWWNIGDQLVASFIDDFWNTHILRSIQTGYIKFNIPFVLNYQEDWPELEGTLDFIGVNYYTRELVKLDLSKPEKFEFVPNEKAPGGHTDLNWEIYPEGFYTSIRRAASFGWPVYITENGIADAQDKKRTKFICDHLREMSFAMEDGADVRGYLHWSLIDNWEWVDGYMPKFGLVEVDFATQKRTVRPSAKVLAQIISSRSLSACGDALKN